MSRRPGPPSWLLLWALGLLEWEVRVWVGSQAPPHPCFLQAAPKASMASSAVRNATVPTGVGATASTGPASVIQGSTAASATSVSPAACWLPPCPGRWGTGLSNGPGTCGAFLPQSSLCSAVTVYSDTRGPGGSARSPAGMGGVCLRSADSKPCSLDCAVHQGTPVGSPNPGQAGGWAADVGRAALPWKLILAFGVSWQQEQVLSLQRDHPCLGPQTLGWERLWAGGEKGVMAGRPHEAVLEGGNGAP